MKEINDASKISKQITRQQTYSVRGSKKTLEEDLHTEAWELTATPKYTKMADPAGQEASEEP